jgi:hypothetical protein
MIEEQMEIKKLLREVLDMFVLQATSKKLHLYVKIAPNVPHSVVSDERRLK